jgi:hypothetical protein
MKKNKSSALLKKVSPFSLFFLFLITPLSVQSATFNPTNGQELKDAIKSVNLSQDPTNTINLIATTYTPIGPLSPITRNVTINGATSNPSDTKISGRNSGLGVFSIVTTGDVTINNVTIADGSALDAGGGILNNLTDLTINNCIIEDNKAEEGGGGIVNINGNVVINDTIIRNNEVTAEDALGGGGIQNSGAVSSMTINRSQITGNNSANDGGGILNIDSPTVMTITDSVIADNEAVNFGGGIQNQNSFMIISNCIIGGLDPEDGNLAEFFGGIGNFGEGGESTMLIRRSTIANNIAMFSGGGLGNIASLVAVSNSTFSENMAGIVGGGIDNADGQLAMNNITVVENEANTGGGIWNITEGGVNSWNSIFAMNEAMVGPDCSGPMTTQGSNLIEQVEGCDRSGTNSNLNSDMIGIDPLVGPLALNLPNNTPPDTFITPTRTLMEGSPAIDMGRDDKSSEFTCTTIDQRGVMRPADGDGDGIAVCDIGAFEVEEEPAPTPTPTPTPTSTPTPTPGGNGFAPGDANGDGNINILDVTVILNDILEISSASGNGDCNEDGEVNILDVTCVLNIILEG